MSYENKRSVPIFSSPQLGTICKGVPVYRYGYTDVLGGSPDLVDSTLMQLNNENYINKLKLKRSIDIKSNMLGTTTPRMPRTSENDYLKLECGNLIDGDPETCWCSNGQSQADVEPVWIRVDLPIERTINKIVLKKRPDGAKRNIVGSQSLDANAVEVGMGMPKRISVKISCDGWHWTTVYEGTTDDEPSKKVFEYNIGEHRAKQIWIIGYDFPKVENWMCCFSIACIEIFDKSGREVSLATYGTAVNVSSSAHTFSQPRECHHWYWPLQYEMGLKWARIGYHDDPINWHWVEKAKGKLAVDPEADLAIDNLLENGVDVIMALGFGNRLYTEHPERNLPQMHEWYYENPLPPSSDEAIKAWARYIEFMVLKYRGRINIFEVWNEWNISPYWGDKSDVDLFIKLSKIAYNIIRELAPNTKIMMGSISGFPFGICKWGDDFDDNLKRHNYLVALKALANDVDMVGWHPFYQRDPDTEAFRDYEDDIKFIRKITADWGFKGEHSITEYNYGAGYPPPIQPNWWGTMEISEIVKAKYVCQISVKHTSMDMSTFFCETWNTLYALDLSLMRKTFSSHPIVPAQPEPAFYVLRNLSNIMDGYTGAQTENYAVKPCGDIEDAALTNGVDTIISYWLKGRAIDECEGKGYDIELKQSYRKATGIDPMNGLEQELVLYTHEGKQVLKDMLIKDYPILIKLEK